MSPWRSILLLCAAAAATWLCAAQAGHGAPAPPAQTATIRASANLVLVDVVVAERGKAVEALPRAHFHILEDGKEQTLTVFDEHRANAEPERSRSPELPPHVYSNYPRFAVTSAANVLLLDALNTPLGDQQNVRRQMVEYLKKIPAGTRLAVFTLASRLRMIEGFTTDVAAIEAAITQGKGGAQESPLLETAQEQDEMSAMGEAMSSVDGGALQQFLADTQSFQTDLRVRMTLDAMEEMGRYLATIPGRKNLIWFSGSFPLEIEPDPTLSDEFSGMREYSDEVEETDSLLTAARVAVYPVDARGLMGIASVDSSRSFSGMQGIASPSVGRGGGVNPNPPGNAIQRVQRADATQLQQTTHEHETMNQIAEETGGKPFYNTNGLAQAVEEAIENGSNYYTVGYVPAANGWDGKFRRIEMRVDGGKYELEYRRGYYAEDPLKPGPATPGATSPVVAALERGAPPLSQIVFEARVLSAKDEAAQGVKPSAGPAGMMTLAPSGSRYLVDFSVDPRGLEWSPLPNGGAGAQIEVTMVAWDAEGKRVNYTDRALGANLNLEESQQAAKQGLPVHQEIDLPAGECWLRVAVHDLRNGRIGTMEIPLKVPKS
ncbi:MAG: VWA domain-containing protein [Acidobacteriaceae bacterium]